MCRRSSRTITHSLARVLLNLSSLMSGGEKKVGVLCVGVCVCVRERQRCESEISEINEIITE
jgi:hypothetical protein